MYLLVKAPKGLTSGQALFKARGRCPSTRHLPPCGLLASVGTGHAATYSIFGGLTVVNESAEETVVPCCLLIRHILGFIYERGNVTFR